MNFFLTVSSGAEGEKQCNIETSPPVHQTEVRHTPSSAALYRPSIFTRTHANTIMSNRPSQEAIPHSPIADFYVWYVQLNYFLPNQLDMFFVKGHSPHSCLLICDKARFPRTTHRVSTIFQRHFSTRHVLHVPVSMAVQSEGYI